MGVGLFLLSCGGVQPAGTCKTNNECTSGSCVAGKCASSALTITNVTPDSTINLSSLQVTGTGLDKVTAASLVAKVGGAVSNLLLGTAQASSLTLSLPSALAVDATGVGYTLTLTAGSASVTRDVTLIKGDKGDKGDAGPSATFRETRLEVNAAVETGSFATTGSIVNHSGAQSLVGYYFTVPPDLKPSGQWTLRFIGSVLADASGGAYSPGDISARVVCFGEVDYANIETALDGAPSVMGTASLPTASQSSAKLKPMSITFSSPASFATAGFCVAAFTIAADPTGTDVVTVAGVTLRYEVTPP